MKSSDPIQGRSLSRRRLLASAAASAAASLFPRWAMAEDSAANIATDPRRPQFHLLPAKNWMNDPNGPVYFNGKYHMFCQFNPLAAVWGDMSWYHSESPDMLHWNHKPLAMTPTPGSPDEYGCFSGSAIKVGKRVYQVYTGTKLSSPELATIRDGENKIQESQCIAWSDDPALVKWTKLPEPIIPLPPPGMKITGFRDPSAWKQGDWYYMTVGSGEAEVGGCVLLYRTKNLVDPKSWEYMHKLTSGEWTGKKTANPCDDGEMWECPDFFALDGGHVLIYSTLGKVIWESGHLDEATMTFTKKKTGELDLGAFYAPKTQLDAKGRRILWGWIQEKRSDAEMKVAGWSGMMSLPRVLSLDVDGTLRVRVLPEAVGLRAGTLPSKGLEVGQKDTPVFLTMLPKASGEVLCVGRKGARMEFTINMKSEEILKATYTPETHKFVVDSKEVQLEASDEPSLHAYVDGSVIELIISERIGYTKRFYYPDSTAPDIGVGATGTADIKLAGWKVGPISKDRLTTPIFTI
ncbi:beta-fructofuranosidase [Granulicella aggregans]|uniref:beta-fructofuranosidase n=1 Tax=Granulicella aggregans TaxID=474949 RepID=A0A7W8E1N9_9BACT|nr:glycoside hydrolase family 32 protein [Granulicella aggregans]MBB5055622.1 beta-fructofuranosidase [Granulicella aggregans]